MTKPLGKPTNIDVRSQWPKEAADFTPWLAGEEDISRLGEAFGLELETLRDVTVLVGDGGIVRNDERRVDGASCSIRKERDQSRAVASVSPA